MAPQRSAAQSLRVATNQNTLHPSPTMFALLSRFSLLRFVIVLLVLEVAMAVFGSLRSDKPYGFLYGDCPYYAATCESLYRDGDWDLTNQLVGDHTGEEASEALHKHGGFFSLSVDGRIVPKHSTLMPICSIPFYAIFGKLGFLIFNLLQVFLLMWCIVLLAGNTPAARGMGVVFYVTSSFFVFTFNYSPDVFGTLLLLGTYLALDRQRPIVAGLLAGLAIWAKVYLALFLLPAALILFSMGWKATAKFTAAVILGVMPMLFINYHLFGHPLVTGYDRQVEFTENGFHLKDHYDEFDKDLTHMGSRLMRLFFDSRIGLLWHSPFWILWPLGVVFGWRAASSSSHRRILAYIAVIVMNLLLFAAYNQWDASAFANRFLFPAEAFGFVLQIPLWERLLAARNHDTAQKPT